MLLLFFFLNNISENNYFRILWTEIHNHKKAFWEQMNDLDLYSDISRDVAMATSFVKKWQTPHFRRSGIQNWNGVTPCICMN